MTCTGDWTTHHTGCACHEARGAAELARVTRERDDAIATLADTARERDAAHEAATRYYLGCLALEEERDAVRADATVTLAVIGRERDAAEEALARAQAVVSAAKALRDSGYDGPFMGDAVEPLFAALAAYEREAQ